MVVQNILNDLGNTGEREISGEEPFHSNFISRIEYGAAGPALLCGFKPQSESREGIEVGRQEFEGVGLCPVSLSSRAGKPVGEQQRVLNGKSHVRGRELRNDRAVSEFDQGMNQGLGMDCHCDFGRLEIEQPARFDDFECFIHHGGGIHRDLGAHVPCRMFQRHRGRDGCHLVASPAAERTSTGCQDDSTQLITATGLEALKDGAVFAVDGNDAGTGFSSPPHDQGSGDNEAFLVGEGHAFSGIDRCPCGRQSGSTDHGADDGGDLRISNQRFDCAESLVPACVSRVFGGGDGNGFAADNGPVRLKLRHLLAETFDAAVSRQACQAQTMGMLTGDVEAAGAD